MISTNGDRLPTRERGYRSANQYVRRRTAIPAAVINQAAGVGQTSPYQEGGLGDVVDPRMAAGGGAIMGLRNRAGAHIEDPGAELSGDNQTQ